MILSPASWLLTLSSAAFAQDMTAFSIADEPVLDELFEEGQVVGGGEAWLRDYEAGLRRSRRGVNNLLLGVPVGLVGVGVVIAGVDLDYGQGCYSQGCPEGTDTVDDSRDGLVLLGVVTMASGAGLGAWGIGALTRGNIASHRALVEGGLSHGSFTLGYAGIVLSVTSAVSVASMWASMGDERTLGSVAAVSGLAGVVCSVAQWRINHAAQDAFYVVSNRGPSLRLSPMVSADTLGLRLQTSL